MDKEWLGFKGTKWKKQIDVEDFIDKNYHEYLGDDKFLCGTTNRTNKILAKVEKLFALEQKRGGVLDIDTKHVGTINTFKAGYIDKKDEIIVGLQTDKPLKRMVSPFSGLNMVKSACEEYGYKLSEDVIEKFQFRTTHNDGVFRAYTPEMRRARHCGVITGLPDAYSRGRLIGDYRRVALYGMDFLIQEKKKEKAKVMVNGSSIENLMEIEDIQKQLEGMKLFNEMVLRYNFDLSKPASNFKEAVQWLYFAYLAGVKEQTGAANSIGRISTFLDIFAERDLKNKILTEIEVQEIIDDFIIKLRMVRHLRTSEYNALFAGDPVWVTMSEGGINKDGKSFVTKTSYRVLNTLYNLKPSAEPNITILWDEKLPDNYKKYCAKVSIDTDAIQYENDSLIRNLYGTDYSIACCVSAMKTGKQMQYFGARCNLAKILLLALNGGRDELKGDLIPETPTKIFNEGLLDYNEVLKSFKKYLSWIAKLYVNTLNTIHFMHDKYAYERFIMSLHNADVDRLMAFGISGFSVLVDSLSAIKYAKVYAIKDDRGIISDFKIEGDYPKYGNDDDRVDSIACKLVKDFYKELCKTPCYRNAKHTLSILTITSNILYGKKTGSTPDGRKKGEPFAPGANPMHNRDLSGALASLNSVAKIDYDTCRDGISNTFSIVPKALGKNKNEQVNNLISLLDGYFKKNAQHLNVNVLNKEKLIDAMKNPKKYPNLTIRVSGYAVNFNKLTHEQQQEVISRTFHEKI